MYRTKIIHTQIFNTQPLRNDVHTHALQSFDRMIQRTETLLDFEHKISAFFSKPIGIQIFCSPSHTVQG